MVTNSNAGRRRRVVASYESLDHGGNNRGLVAPDIEIKSLLCNFPLLWLVCVGSLEYILPWSSGDSDPELKKSQKLYQEISRNEPESPNLDPERHFIDPENTA